MRVTDDYSSLYNLTPHGGSISQVKQSLSKTPDNRYICGVGGCQRAFKQSYILYRHQREKHGAAYVRPASSASARNCPGPAAYQGMSGVPSGSGTDIFFKEVMNAVANSEKYMASASRSASPIDINPVDISDINASVPSPSAAASTSNSTTEEGDVDRNNSLALTETQVEDSHQIKEETDND